MGRKRKAKLVLGKDYYYANGRCVLTRNYLLSTGHCCNHNCLECPFKACQNGAGEGSAVSRGLAVMSQTGR